MPKLLGHHYAIWASGTNLLTRPQKIDVVLSRRRLSRILTHNLSGDLHWLHM